AGEERLDAAALPAVAGRAGGIDRVMPPLARDVLRARPHTSVDHETAAHARAEDYAEDEPVAQSCAAARLGEREAVGVVLEPDGPERLVEDHPLDLRAAEIDPERPHRRSSCHSAGFRARRRQRRTSCRMPRAAPITTPTRT